LSFGGPEGLGTKVPSGSRGEAGIGGLRDEVPLIIDIVYRF